ncbi:hypothetical protein ERHA55_32610 [Erwinia rhapontici]|nr:hypothetical protein [Erwinia rhapontici]BCQ45734.1 hypothetical protein ERHA55_32610 [Erwinia rhapontici]
MATKIVLVGAGSAQFGYGTLGDIFQSRALYGSEIILHDINPVALAVTEKTAKDFLAKEDLPFIVSATTDRRTALRGAEFVIISIEVGDRFALWDLDWQIPQQYGIQQVYGENGGPGGYSIRCVLFHRSSIFVPMWLTSVLMPGFLTIQIP